MTGMACRATTQKHHLMTGHGPATDQAWLNHGSVVAKPRPELPAVAFSRFGRYTSCGIFGFAAAC